MQETGGKLFIIPSRLSAVEITKILREGYSVELLIEGFHQIVKELKLDYLLIDTHPGINEETLIALSVSNVLFVVMRPDSQDYQGTAVTVDIAKTLEVPRILLVVNKIPQVFDLEDVRKKVENLFIESLRK